VAVFAVIDQTGTSLALVAATGYSAKYLRDWQRFSLELPTPIGDAVQQRRTIVVGSLEEVHRRYAHIVLPDERPYALIAFPVVWEDSVVGGVGLRFDVETIGVLDPHDLEVAAGFGEATASSLVQARLIDQLRETVAQLQAALDSRVVIEQAKGVLAGRHGVSPDEAFEALWSLARSRSARLRDLARQVVDEASRQSASPG
jgi:GAF domain-containing protein